MTRTLRGRSGLRSISPMGRSPIGLRRCLRVCPVCIAAGDPADAIIAQPTASAQRAKEDHAAYGLPIDTTLTARELKVLALLAEGASNKMIARRLAISVHTAKFHVASVIDKLDAIGRTDAVAHAARLGIIEL